MLENGMYHGSAAEWERINEDGRKWAEASEKADADRAERRQTYVALLMADEASMADLLLGKLSEMDDAAETLRVTVSGLVSMAAHAAAIEDDSTRRANCAGYAKAMRMMLEVLAKEVAADEVGESDPEKFMAEAQS